MSDLQSPNYPQQNPLGSDPKFLTYLQGFMANPINAGKIQGKRISQIPVTDGQTLVWVAAKNQWVPTTVSSGSSGTVTYVKTVNFVGQSITTGTITFVNGVITSYS